MKKLLIASGGYTPGKNYGGPVVSISNLVNVLGNVYEIYVVTRNHDLDNPEVYQGVKEGWNMVGKARVLYLSEENINYRSFKKIVKEIDPDLIYQNSFFASQFLIPLLIISRQLKKKILIAPRGELLENAIKQKKVKKYIYTKIVEKLLVSDKNTLFHATSINEIESIKKVLNMNVSNIFMLENFPMKNIKNIEKIQKEENCLKIVYIARIHPTKNLKFALVCLKKVSGNVDFNIYGNIENQDYWQDCLDTIKELPKNIKVKYCGVASREEIQLIYSENHVLFLPTLTENYGHSIVEAMISNCPVIISDNTPWTSINKYRSGFAISLSAKEKYSETIQKLINMKSEDYNEILEKNKVYIEENLNIKNLKNRYIETFNNIQNRIKI